MSKDEELEKALGQVKSQIKASRNQPDVPELTTEKETAMSTEKKTSKKTKKDKAEKTAPVDGYTSTQLAEELGIDSATLRKGLRAIEAKKPGGRWVWDKKTDPSLVEIRKQLKEWLAEPKAKKESAKKDKPAKKKADKEKKGNGKKAVKKPAKKKAKKEETASASE